MVRYQSTIIQQYAEDLYRQADTIVVVNTSVGAVIGFVVGLMAVRVGISPGPPLVGVAGGFLLGSFIGFQAGARKALLLRIHAQQALCQMMIERNTAQKDGSRPVVPTGSERTPRHQRGLT